MDLEVRDLDPLGVERPDDGSQLAGALVEAHRDPAGARRLLGPEPVEHRAHPVAVGLVGGHCLDGRPADLGLERVRGALGDDLAGVDDPDPVGERVGLLQVLGGEEDGDAVRGGEPLDLVPERGAALHVEAGRRLVEEQDPWLVDERQREVEAPSHAARVAADLAVGRLGQADPGDQLVAAAQRLGLRQPVHSGLQPHVLARGQELVERRLLEGDADLRRGPRAPRLTMSWPATRARARGRGQQGGEHVDGGRLAGAVGAEEAVDLARRDGQVDPVDRPRPLLELLDQPLDLDPVVTSHLIHSLTT